MKNNFENIATTQNGTWQPGYIRSLSACWKELAESQQRISFQKGERLSFITDRRLASKFAFVASGCLYTYIDFPDGSERLKLVIDQHCLIFEAYGAAGRWERDCYHVARTDVTLALFDSSLLQDDKFIHTHPLLVANALRSTAIKYVHFDALLDCVYKNSSLQKIAWYINKLGELNNHAIKLRPMLSQKEIASLLCISQASMTRGVASLRQDGIISKFTQSEIQVSDYPALQALAEA